jgi:hypothetical protein
MTNAANFNDYNGDGVFGRDKHATPHVSITSSRLISWCDALLLNAFLCKFEGVMSQSASHSSRGIHSLGPCARVRGL